MAKIGYAILISVLAVVFATWIGCSKEAAAPSAGPEEEVNEEVVEEVEVPALDTTAEPETGASAESNDVTAALASLSEADRAAVLAQKICPVSDEALGSMGAPIKVTVDGRDVFICCESCRDPLVADPTKYLAKLDGK
jgi:hypothetical protein